MVLFPEIPVKGEQGHGGRDAQSSFMTGKDAAFLGWRDFIKCNSPAVNKNGLKKVEWLESVVAD
jgi:hypothetical protein